jgi:hypothetical protein
MKLQRFVLRLGWPGRVDLGGSQAQRGWLGYQVNKNEQVPARQVLNKEANLKTPSSRYGDWTYGKCLVFGSERTDPIRGQIERRNPVTLCLRPWWSREILAKGV